MMREHPLAIGFAIYATLAFYTYVVGVWWRVRADRRMSWRQVYTRDVVPRVAAPLRRQAFATVRFGMSIGWPAFAARRMQWRLETAYRFARFKVRTRLVHRRAS